MYTRVFFPQIPNETHLQVLALSSETIFPTREHIDFQREEKEGRSSFVIFQVL